MARGYWEAKDSHDDLDAEIKVKFNLGYPRDNIIFEDSQTAVLVQNGNEAMRVDMSRDGELHRLIRIFQCLPLYRYTEDGERVSNITQWGIDHINGHYRQEWGEEFESMAGEDGITAEEIFAYTYVVLHDPAYRHEYAVDLLREFPRLPLYPDFHQGRDGPEAAGPAHRVRVRRAVPAGAARP